MLQLGPLACDRLGLLLDRGQPLVGLGAQVLQLGLLALNQTALVLQLAALAGHILPLARDLDQLVG